MIKNITTYLVLLIPVLSFGQDNILNSLIGQYQGVSFELSGKVSTNVVSVPTRQNTLKSTNAIETSATFEEYQSNSAGLSGEVRLSPILHQNFFYTYQHEWSMGLGAGTSYHYQLWGSELGLGIKNNYLTYHLKNRFINVIGYSPKANGSSSVDEEVHYSKYSGIRQHAIGLKLKAGNNSNIEFAFLMEKFKAEPNQEPWQGAFFRWDRLDKGWGLETMVFWSHPAYGYYFTSEAPEGEFEPTGLFINFKLNYKFGYRNSYAKVLSR